MNNMVSSPIGLSEFWESEPMYTLGRCLVNFTPKYFHGLETPCVCYNSKH